MDERGYRFGVGVLVLASAVISIILVFFFGAVPNLWTEYYNVTINFRSAPGVENDTPVRKNGVRIGRVIDVDLKPDDGGVDLTLELEKKYQIRIGETVRIATGSLITGDAIVEFLPPRRDVLLARFDGVDGNPKDGALQKGEQDLAAAYLKDQDYITDGQVAPDPMNAMIEMQDGFATTLKSIDAAGVEVASLAKDLRTVMGSNEGQVQQIMKKTELTIDNFNRTLDAIESIFNDPQLSAAMQASIERFPKLIDDSAKVLEQTQMTLRSFEKVGIAAESTLNNAEGALANIEQFTEPLADRGPEIVDDTLRTMDNLDALLLDLRRFSSRVNSGNGTVARLIEDDQLYVQLVQTLENVERLTVQLQPIVNDARVFSDKIARDPRQLGVRGALDSRPSGVGLK